MRGKHSPRAASAFLKTLVFKNILDFFGSCPHTWLENFRFHPASRQKEQEADRKNAKLAILQMVGAKHLIKMYSSIKTARHRRRKRRTLCQGSGCVASFNKVASFSKYKQGENRNLLASLRCYRPVHTNKLYDDEKSIDRYWNFSGSADSGCGPNPLPV